MKRLLIVGATLVFASAMAVAQSSGGTSGASSTDQQTSGANSNSTGSYSQDANPTANSGDMSSQQSQSTNPDSSQTTSSKHKKKTHKDNGTDVRPSDNKGVMGGDSSRENTSSPNANSSTLPGQKVSHPPDSNSQSNPDTNPHL